MMAAVLRTLLLPGLIILTVLQLSSAKVIYVRRGSDITDCSMKCPHTDGVLQLYRDCGGEETLLLELWCDTMWLRNRYEPRLLYNMTTGCWSLREAGKNDSCVYIVVYDNGTRFLTTLPVTVLDPVLISNMTSNSSRPGEDIAVSVQFSGEEATLTWEVDGGLLPDRYRLIDDNRTVIIPRAQRDDIGRRLSVRITNPVSEETREHQLKATDPVSVSSPGGYVTIGIVFTVVVMTCIALLVKCRCCKKTEDKERRPEETGDRISSSQTDLPGEKSLLIRIRKIWGRIRGNPEYEETPQRDVEMSDVLSVPAAETGRGAL
ncbi:uncharacterized protein LOC143814943 isoform X2 [Ranitomeya variabilis]|uniref:uncharacterized protein LOC143814943 isoform X2 n=1 Tax=Ranitomeya variabilis TaxID=490064 RepID=UPI004056A228